MEHVFKDAKECQSWFTNGGYLPDGKKLALKDALKIEDMMATSDSPIWMPQAISNLVRESAEPILVGTSFMQRVMLEAGNRILNFPAVGAIHVEDMAEAQEYPETDLNMGGSQVLAAAGKVGIAVKFSEEMIEQSDFDIMGMWLREAGRGFARHKENKIFTFIRSMGQTVFDNLNPANSVMGVTHGRDAAGNANGSLTADDFFDAFVQVLRQGFEPNVVFMHPFTWNMFVKDATLRSFVLANGGGTYFATWNGQPYNRAMWPNEAGRGAANGRSASPSSATADLEPQFQQSSPNMPSYWHSPFRIIVTSQVPYDHRNQLTDIYIADGSNIGALLVGEELNSREWDVPSQDIKKIRLREKYGIHILEDGQAIAVIKNVKTVPNEIVLPATATFDTSTLSAIGRNDDVL